MAKMVSLKRPKSEKGDMTKSPEAMPYPEDEGVAVNLDHHHLEKMGLGGSLKSGDDVEFTGRGKVERSETRTDDKGEHHSATLRLHRGAVDHEPSSDDEKTALKGELNKNYADAQAQSGSLPDK